MSYSEAPSTDLGAEPQPTHVAAFHTSTLTPALRIGEKEDLYIREGKVVVLGLIPLWSFAYRV